MAQPTLTIKGQNLTPYVVSWGSLQVVKKLRLSDSSIVTSAFSLPLDNTKGFFTPGGPASFFPEKAWTGAEAIIERDGMEIYRGYLQRLAVDDSSQQATVELSDSLTEAVDAVADLTDTDLNPAAACRSLFVAAGLGDRLNSASFSVAAGFLAGNTIDVTCPASRGESVLGLASKIADVCSLDFVLVRNQIYCTVQRPFDGSGLRQGITASLARNVGVLGHEDSAFANVVSFAYGANLVVTVRNEASIRAENGVVASTSAEATDSSLVTVGSEAVARFYASLLLSRTSPRRRTLDVTLGPEFKEIQPGWRFPVTYAPIGMTSEAFEVNEAVLNLDSDEWEVKLSSLEVAR